MTISAAYNPIAVHNLPRPPQRRPSAWRAAVLVGLALVLSGCIDPSAPPLGTPPTVVALPNSTLSGATPNPAAAGKPTATFVPVPATIAPASAGGTPPPQTLPLAADGPWKTLPIGPESVSIVFFSDANTKIPCIGYVFRINLVQHCAASGQPLALVAGTMQPADGKNYTLIAGRTLNGQVSGVSIEFADSTFQSMGITDGGFSLVLDGIHKPIDIVPIDQYGNLVVGKVPF